MELTDNTSRLGFIGLGLMGAPMTRRLLGAGYPVMVWNRTLRKAKELVHDGAVLGASPKKVADATDILLMCLTDAAAVETVVFGANGAAKGERFKYLVDFSSIRPDAAAEMAARLRKEHGANWIDAPVSGGTAGAAAGTLAIMAGGSARAVDAVRPVLAHLGGRVTHMGPSGAGQMTKLVNQVIVGANIAVMAEAVNLARQAGVDATRLAEALAGGWADSKPFQAIAPRMAAGAHEDPLGYLYTMLKDLDAAREVGRGLQAALPMASMAAELLRFMDSRGFGETDISTLIKLYDQASG